MTSPTPIGTSEPAPVKVHVVNHPASPAPKERTVSLGTVKGDATNTGAGGFPAGTNAPFLLLARNTNRGRVTMTFVGDTASTVAYLCVSQGDAQGTAGAEPAGAIVLHGMVLDYEATDELWLGVPSGSRMRVGLTREFTK